MEALSTEERLATLIAAWPEWEFWIMRVWDGISWCARPRGDHTVVLNSDSAARLAAHVAEATLLGPCGEAEFPAFRIWREAVGDRVRYVARSRDLATRPHTLVTGDLGELRAALGRCHSAAQGAASLEAGR